MSDDDVLSGGRRLPHPLALAWFALFALLLAAVLYVAVLGKASDSGPMESLDLTAHKAPAHKATTESKIAAKTPAKPQTPADLIGAGPKPGTGVAKAPAKTANAAQTPGKTAPEPKLPPKIVPEDRHQAGLCRPGADRRSGADRADQGRPAAAHRR